MSSVVRTRAVLIAAALVTAGLVVSARQDKSQDQNVFRAGTQTVPIFATVVGPDGRLVTDLNRDDFEVYEDHKRQPLTVFGNDIQPINIVVLLDTSDSMVGTIDLLKEAASELFTHLLPNDQARVGSFGERITVSPKFTSNQNELIRWMFDDVEAGGPTPLWGAVNVGMTALEHIEGRRVVLVFTDGYNAMGRNVVSLHDVTSRAQSDEFMVYSIGLWSRTTGRWVTKSPHGPMSGLPPDPGLKTLSDETGGGYFELWDPNNLGPIFSQVADELHHQYLLGFEAQQLDGKLHKLEVKVKKPSMTTRARRSYVAKEPGR